jgi:glycine dehydrogenase subunit 1
VQDILGGYPLGEDYPELENCLLLCATETKSDEDIARLVENLQRIIGRNSDKPVCTKLKPQDPSKYGF